LNIIHGIKDKGSNIIEALDFYTKKDIDKWTVKDLMNVDGIGKITAKMIISEIGK